MNAAKIKVRRDCGCPSPLGPNSSLRFNAHSLRISYELDRANRNESNGEPKKKAFLCSFSGFLLRHSFFLILRPIIAGFHSPNKKVIAKLLTIPLNLLQVSAHILACLLLHGSTTTNMPKEWKMSLMEIRETWIKMTSKEERGRTFGVTAVVLGIGGVLISYFPLPFFASRHPLPVG